MRLNCYFRLHRRHVGPVLFLRGEAGKHGEQDDGAMDQFVRRDGIGWRNLSPLAKIASAKFIAIFPSGHLTGRGRLDRSNADFRQGQDRLIGRPDPDLIEGHAREDL